MFRSFLANINNLIGFKPVRKKSQPRHRLSQLENLEERRVMAVYAEVVKEFTNSIPSPGYELAENFYRVGNLTYFTHNGDELWRTDNTPAGTYKLDDLTTLTNFVPPTGENFLIQEESPFNDFFQTSNGKLYYPSHGAIMQTDGTLAGTKAFVAARNNEQVGLSHYYAGVSQHFRMVGNQVYFGAETYTDRSLSFENNLYGCLWKSDGTAAGTTFIKDLGSDNFTGDGGWAPISQSAAVGNTLYFFTKIIGHTSEPEDPNAGFELWKSDGTTAGTSAFLDLDNSQHLYEGTFDQRLESHNGSLYFTYTMNGKYRLYKTNGTVDGTTIVVESNSDIGSLQSRHGNLYATYGGLRLVDEANHLLKPIGGDVDYKGQFYSIDFQEVIKMDYDGSNATSAYSNFGYPVDDHTYLINYRLSAGKDFGSDSFVTDGRSLIHRNSGTGDLYKSDGTTEGVARITTREGLLLEFTYSLTRAGNIVYFVANHPKTEIPTLFRLGYGAATRVFTNGTGQIEIRDLNNAPSVMKITRSEANLVIADLAVDPENTMRLENVPGASLSADKRTVTIPFATIEATGKPLFIVGGQETDVVRFDSGNVPNADLVPATGIHLNLGPEDDKITANWGGGLDEIDLSATQSSNAWLFNAFERGSVKLGNTGTVSFNSLDSAKGGSGQDIFTYSSTVIKRNLNYSDPYGSGQTGLQGGDGLDILLIQANADLYTWRKFSSMETSYLLLISTPGAFRAPSLSLRAPKGSKVLNGIESFEYTGGAGNNFIDARAFGAPMTLRGGGGNDTLWGTPFNDVITGGDGNDLISGGAGNDTIIGNAGRDILIGGLGADQLNDSSVPLTGSGDDILIGGRSTYEFNRTVLQAILATWTGPGSFVQRIHAIQITGVGPNKNYRFNSNTVTDDSAVDILFGGSNDDWFFAKTNAPNADTHDANPLEQLKVVSL